MKVINLADSKKRAKEDFVDEIAKDLKQSTNFIVITSNDDLSLVYDRYFNLSTVELIGVLDVVKHKALHEALPDDDGERENIPAEIGGR